MSKDRNSYGSLDLRLEDGVVHLANDELPEVVAIGHDVLETMELFGGPNVELTNLYAVSESNATLEVRTPEGNFTYELLERTEDAEGKYGLWRLTDTDSTYHAFLAGH